MMLTVGRVCMQTLATADFESSKALHMWCFNNYDQYKALYVCWEEEEKRLRRRCAPFVCSHIVNDPTIHRSCSTVTLQYSDPVDSDLTVQ
jgi:hypothetical protein